MKASTVVTILFILLIYYLVFRTHAGELFGVKQDRTIPQVYKYGNFSDPNRITIGILAGVHGNEPSGTEALQELIQSDWFNKNEARKFNFVIVPRANEYGLRNNIRWTDSIAHPDLNRSFTERGGDILSEFLMKEFANVDLLLDFHEGWGWHKINHSSIGSTLSPTKTSSGLSLNIAKAAADNINSNIDNINKKFQVLPDISCDIKSALSCYMERAGREYILTETTGQKNIQPINVRTDQVKNVIDTAVTQLLQKE
jgi:predicted deacylase